MSILEYEYTNTVPPYVNSPALKSKVGIAVTPTAAFTDLKLLFGKPDTGHFYTLQADGAKCYFAFDFVPTGSIAIGPGSGATQCWPLADGQQMRVHVVHGRPVATGIATALDFRYLQYIGSGTLHVYRSSTSPNQGVETFPVPNATP